MIEKISIEKINKVLHEAIKDFNRKNFDESKDLFLKVLDQDPINPEANYYLGLMYSKETNWKKAVLHLKSVVDMGINFLYTQQCRMILGYIYFMNKEYRRAEYEIHGSLKVKTSDGSGVCCFGGNQVLSR